MISKQKQQEVYYSSGQSTTVTFYNSNSSKIKREFLEVVVKGALIDSSRAELSKYKNRKLISEFIQAFFEDQQKEGAVINSKVIFNERNNNNFVDKDVFIIDINFIQKNCINTTRINIELFFLELESSPTNFRLVLT